jgi:hypothetical protein
LCCWLLLPFAAAVAVCCKEDVNGEALTLMVPYCDMANHCSSHNSTFCISKDFKRWARQGSSDGI